MPFAPRNQSAARMPGSAQRRSGCVVGAGTGLGRCGCFDRLLVEAGTRLARAPAAGGREAEVVAATLDTGEPGEQPQALLDKLRAREGEAGGDAGR